MGRHNTEETPESVEAIAKALEEVAGDLRALAERWKKRCKGEVLTVAHRSSFESGLLSLTKFRRECSMKLDNLEDQQRWEKMRQK